MPAGTRSKFAKGSSGGSGGVSSVTNTDGTLTFNPTTGAVVGSLNLSNPNTWDALQTFPTAGILLTPGTGSLTATTGQLWYVEGDDMYQYQSANLGDAGPLTPFLAPLVNGDLTLWLHPTGGADDSGTLIWFGQDQLPVLTIATPHPHPLSILTIGGLSDNVVQLSIDTVNGVILDDGSGNMTVPGVLTMQGVPTEQNDTTGSGTALLGTNCPATTVTAPHAWMEVITSDGSNGYIPVWV